MRLKVETLYYHSYLSNDYDAIPYLNHHHICKEEIQNLVSTIRCHSGCANASSHLTGSQFSRRNGSYHVKF